MHDFMTNLLASSNRFLHEVRVELTKVVWPDRQEFIGSTIVVFFIVAVFALYLGTIDVMLSALIQYIFKVAL